jgi:CheY-like chemotaxis protein
VSRPFASDLDVLVVTGHNRQSFEELLAMVREEEVDVLLVEDNANDAEFALRALRKAAVSPRVLHVDDGARALDYLFGTGEFAGRVPHARPSVVLLDLKLPKVDGIEVLRRIKEDPRTRDIPVVVLTSSKEPRDIEACYMNRANSYVVKPVNFEVFTHAMAELAHYWIEINQAPMPPSGP